MLSVSASRRGTRRHNCDAVAVFTAADGTVAAALVDGIGNSTHVADVARLCAQTAARVGAQRGPLAGILSAALLVADPAEDANGVAICAVTDPDGGPVEVAWVGDCRGYGWDGRALHRHTTDHTIGQQLRVNGVPVEVAAEHDNWVRTTLAHAVVATVYQVEIPGLVVLTSDGVHDRLADREIAALVGAHSDLQEIADAVVGAVAADEDGYRDDATVVLIHVTADPPATRQER
jgi:protein phosphatase